jgi:HD-like signal output (HDOD) protein
MTVGGSDIIPRGEAEVIDRLRSVQALPALPSVVAAVSKRMASPRVNIAEIARLMAHDQGLTVRVLRLANSAFYATKEAVRTPEQAVVLLGLSTVRSLILKASIFDAFDVTRAKPFWLHALGTACAARAIAKISGLGRADDAFVMGLLHDLGKLALNEHLPKAYAQVKELVARDNILIRDAERMVLDCDHAAVGHFLGEHWSLPAEFTEAIAAHHDLSLASEAHRPWAACVHLADIIARAMLIGNGGDRGIPSIDPRALPLLRLSETDFSELFRAAENELGKAEVFFTIIEG